MRLAEATADSHSWILAEASSSSAAVEVGQGGSLLPHQCLSPFCFHLRPCLIPGYASELPKYLECQPDV